MAYDDATGAVLLFGGFNGAYLSDTWSFAQGNWTRLHPATSPSIRADAGIAFDPKTGSVILFGGASPALRNDTWQFFGGTWTSIASARAPSPRSDTTLVEDPEAGGVVLFGGAGTHPLNDTWLMQAGSWSNLSSTIAPSPRAGAAASFDSVDGYVVLFGGATGPAANQTWEFRAHAWTELFPPHTPAARSFAGAAFDPVDGVSLLFGGGWTGTSFSDLWGYRAAPATLAWLNVSTGTAPAARTQAAFAYDPADGYVLLFGGENHQANNASVPFFHDTWSYRGGVWTKLAVGTSPSARRGAMMEYDPHLGAMVLFGGSNTTSYLNDTWKFRGGTWTHLVTSVAPPPRRSGSLAWDPSTATMVLYGGHNGTGGGLNGWYGIYSDTWEYRSTGWARVTGSPSPEPRAEALLAYDPTEAQLVLFGGYEQNHSHPWEEELNSTWTFHDGRWANLTAAIGGRAPLHRDGAGFVYDPAAGALYLFGGDDNTPNPINTTWTFAFDRWTEVCNCHATLWTADHAAYDAADGYIVTPAGHAALLSTVIFAPQSFVAASAMPNPVDANRTTVLTAWSGGGSGPLALAWTLGSGRVAAGREVATVYSSPGPHAVSVWANGSGVGSVAGSFSGVVNQ
ncbi:MAG: kelch repeat-containing protein, partial [Candidatus Lutacidiplasmatales archaeon]